MPKRRAGTELNQDNWDAEDEKVEPGHYEKADKTSLATRKILTPRSGPTVKSGTSGLFKSFTGFSSYQASQVSPALNFMGKVPLATENSGITSTFDPNSNSATKKLNGASNTSPEEEEQYFSQIQSLNKCVLAWITKHVGNDPCCVLSPIFRDYDKHLDSIAKKFPQYATNKPGSFEADVPYTTKSNLCFDPPSTVSNINSVLQLPKANEGKNVIQSSFPAAEASTSNKSKTPPKSVSEPVKPSLSTMPTFIFGAPPMTSTKSTPSFFNFGSGNSATSLPKPGFFTTPEKMVAVPHTSTIEEEEDEYVPPKPEVREIKEEGSVYSTRCKLFYKVGTDWRERGLGNLFIKPTADDKFQLLIRADTNLGNILLNILVTKEIPMRVQKNNVAFVCVPSPALPKEKGASKTDNSGDDQKPVPMLIRVKTEAAAEDLLAKFDAHRGMSTST